MRLLDARTLLLVDVAGDDVPPYAILSHTWGDEEITIQQLRRLGGCSPQTLASPQTLDKKRRATVLKKGYIKISGAAQLAVSRGLDYIWVDTCCIDKTSSAELSEAINSMYLWYEQSAECYTYLSDVEPVAADADAFNNNLRRSRWFTRGWTLQELIAPKVVLFYAKDWSFLGQKHDPPDFTKSISEITNIDQEVLNGTIDPLQLSVSARMAWASHRNTTRLEDTAYCLMGLFQVNMPLLYGEGRRAFTRLQQEIIQNTDDQSIFAWNNFDGQDEDPDALYGLLAQSPAQFKHAGSLQILPPLPIYASAPSAMTNQGLCVQLYIRQRAFEDRDAMDDDYYAILDCVKRDGDVYQCPALYLRRLSEDQYGRLRPKDQLFMPPPSPSPAFPPTDGYRSVYVRQEPAYYHLPQFRLSPFNVESALSSSDGVQYRLFDTYPAKNWNSATMTLKVQYSRKMQAMGIFRFQRIEKMDDKVDVVVGLRRLNTMEWEGWCFQLSYHDVSLEHAFHEVNKQIEDIVARPSTTSQVASKTLRDELGHDSSLPSRATVEGIQLQGRLYVSLQVAYTAEIQTHKQLFVSTARPILLSKSNRLLSSASANSSARAMTETYCLRLNLPFEREDYAPSESFVQPVRSWLSTTGAKTVRGEFMKPIRSYVNFLRHGTPDKDLTPTNHLVLALYAGDTELAEAVLANNTINLETQTADYHGFAPLHWAVVGGSTSCIMLLLERGANNEVLTKRGLSAIHVAVLCSNRAWDDLASLWGQTEHERLADARTKHFSETPLHLAAASIPDNDPHLAFFRDVMDWSLEFTGMNPRNAFDETPLHLAAAANNVGVIRTLASRTKDLYVDYMDQYGRTPLWHAAAAGALDAASILVRSHGASVNLTDDLGRSPLHAASRGGHHDTVSLLLEMGARTDTETNLLNLLPMDLAAMFGFTMCLRHLLDSRWRVVTRENLDRSLQIAASFGWYDCVDLLCQHGASPFVAFGNYLRDRDDHAEVVDSKADAYNAALAEGRTLIVTYFDTSDTCRHHRELRYSRADNIIGRPPGPPSFSAPVGAPPPPGAAAPLLGAPLPPVQSAPAIVPSSGEHYRYKPLPPVQSAPAIVPSSGEHYRYKPQPLVQPAPAIVPSSGQQYQYAPQPPTQSAPAIVPGTGQQYQYAPQPPVQSAPAIVPSSGEHYRYAPLPPTQSAPAAMPGNEQPYQDSSLYDSTPSYPGLAYGNAPSYSIPADGSTPYSSRISAPSSLTPQQGSGNNQAPGRYQSTILPARTSANTYNPVVPSQSERLQRLVNPYDPFASYKPQDPGQFHPTTYTTSSAPAASTSNQDSNATSRDTSVPAYNSASYQVSEAIVPVAVPIYQVQPESVGSAVTPLASPPASPEESHQRRDSKRESARMADVFRKRR
ncbi:hypothetical protein V8C35DRAFT_45465 [Trichoderma chlorosporum]